MLFAFSPLVTGSWVERFEVFAFAMIGLVAFSIFVENFWDYKLKLFERVLFGASALLLLSQDSLIGVESYFNIVPNVHIIGFIIFAVTMYMHKKVLHKK